MDLNAVYLASSVEEAGCFHLASVTGSEDFLPRDRIHGLRVFVSWSRRSNDFTLRAQGDHLIFGGHMACGYRRMFVCDSSDTAISPENGDRQLPPGVE